MRRARKSTKKSQTGTNISALSEDTQNLQKLLERLTLIKPRNAEICAERGEQNEQNDNNLAQLLPHNQTIKRKICTKQNKITRGKINPETAQNY